MRKLIALLTVLMLGGPAIAFLCHCCPMSVEKPLQTPVIAREGCGCCLKAFRIDEKSSAVKENYESPVSLPSIRLLSSALATSVNLLDPFVGLNRFPRLTASGPPYSSSETPLYLALGVLRI